MAPRTVPSNKQLSQIETVDASAQTPERIREMKIVEMKHLQHLWNTDKKALAARVIINSELGWPVTEMSDMIGISRVSLYSHLRDLTRDQLAGAMDANVKRVTLDFRSKQKRQDAHGVAFKMDKIVVPPEFHPTLNALARTAYHARGSAAAGYDLKLACVNDCMDIYVSLLLRRGVTNMAIAHAVGMTHRAIIDRMNRARRRAFVLTADETFYGDRDVKALDVSVSTDDPFWAKAKTLDFVAVQSTASDDKTPRTWTRVLVNQRTGKPIVFRGSRKGTVDLSAGIFERDGILPEGSAHDLANITSSSPLLSEFRTTLILAAFQTPRARANRLRGDRQVHLVPAEFYYGELLQHYKLDRTSNMVPSALMKKYFVDCEEAMNCLETPSAVLLEQSAPRKHKERVHTLDVKPGQRRHDILLTIAERGPSSLNDLKPLLNTAGLSSHLAELVKGELLSRDEEGVYRLTDYGTNKRTR